MGPGIIITDEITELLDRGPKNMWVNKQANLGLNGKRLI